jgi:hypothetical protein
MTPPLRRAEKGPSEVQILPPFHSTNLDRNADNHQRTTANIDEHEVALEATGGIPRNTGERGSSYLSFGTIYLIASRKRGRVLLGPHPTLDRSICFSRKYYSKPALSLSELSWLRYTVFNNTSGQDNHSHHATETKSSCASYYDSRILFRPWPKYCGVNMEELVGKGVFAYAADLASQTENTS